MSTLTSTEHDTPLGPIVLAFADEHLLRLEFAHGGVDASQEAFARRFGVAPDLDREPAAALCDQIDEYFAGARTDFDVNLDWRSVRGFTRTALEAVRRIPYGETASYGDVAVLAGVPRAARAVGTACAATPFPLVVPVHRVVRADGTLGEYGGHTHVKRALLALEGVATQGDTLPLPG